MIRQLRWLAGAALLPLLLALAAPARAEIDSPLVRAGVAAYEALDYARAVSLLRRARKERLTVEELTVTLRTLGSAEIALGDEAAAREDFEALVRLAPGLVMDRATSPRIRTVFEEARANVLAAQAAPPVAPPAADGRAREAAPAPPGDGGAAADPQVEAPPPSPAPAPRLRVDGAVATPAQATPAGPVAPDPIDGETRAVPIHRRAWFWVALGALAAGAVAAVVVLSRSPDGRLVVVPR